MKQEAVTQDVQIDAALERLGREIGVEPVNGALFIAFDEFWECIVTATMDNRLAMEIALMIVPGARRDEIMLEALKLNADPSATGDGSLSLDPTGSILTLGAKKRLRPGDPEALGRDVAVLIEAARLLVDRLTGEDRMDRPPPTPFDPSSFLIRA